MDVLLHLLSVTITVNQLLAWYRSIPTTYYFNDTLLWDGAGCVDNCCDDTTQCWDQLSQTTQDDIEARICSLIKFSEGSVLVNQLELYIQ